MKIPMQRRAARPCALRARKRARYRVTFTFVFAVCAAPGAAFAHPMGSASINEYSAVRIEKDEVRVRYILDLAEIPSYPELKAIDADSDGEYSPGEIEGYSREAGRKLAPGLRLEVDGRRSRLTLENTTVSILPGLPGLNTVRVEMELSAPLEKKRWGKRKLHYEGENYPGRKGWKEIEVFESAAHRVVTTSALSPYRSDGLTRYPKKLRRTPPDDTRVEVAFARGRGRKLFAGGGAPEAGRFGRESQRFARYLEVSDLPPGLAFLALGTAFFLGCAHALSPGHGKTLVAAYLVGAKGGVGDALALGVIVTATHVFSVLALGVGVLFASRYVVPERITPWLGAASGAIISAIGVWIFIRAARGIHPDQHVHRGRGHGHEHEREHPHAHDNGHEHEHEHPHAHGVGHHDHAAGKEAPAGGGVRMIELILLGIQGGIVPCPTAMVVLLSATALHRIAFGISLIVVFSIGLAFVLIAIGILLVKARALAERLTGASRLMRTLPYASGAAVVTIGAAIVIRSLGEAGVL
ncbi:MAG: hypothetical protein AB1742_12005 [bacterium]